MTEQVGRFDHLVATGHTHADFTATCDVTCRDGTSHISYDNILHMIFSYDNILLMIFSYDNMLLMIFSYDNILVMIVRYDKILVVIVSYNISVMITS